MCLFKSTFCLSKPHSTLFVIINIEMYLFLYIFVYIFNENVHQEKDCFCFGGSRIFCFNQKAMQHNLTTDVERSTLFQRCLFIYLKNSVITATDDMFEN